MEKACKHGMKALLIIMPWAWLIMKFGKDVENRTWRTDYRGTILIHASKKPSPYTAEILQEAFGKTAFEKVNCYEIEKLCGCIIGSVEIVDCVKNYKSRWAEPDLWHWVLRNPVLFDEPIPARGSLGLWTYGGKQ
jgi:hypothetical protein